MKYKGNREGTAVYQEADVSSKRIFGNHTLCAQFLCDYSGLAILANVQAEDIEDVSERYHLFQEAELESDTVKKVHLRNQPDGKPQDMYVISLIEHKSSVDYDVTMQILKYMVCIWENYVRELEETLAIKPIESGGAEELDGIESGRAEELDGIESGGSEEPSGKSGGAKEPDGTGRPAAADVQLGGEQKKHRRINRRKDFRYPPIYPIVYYEGTGEWTAARHLKERILLGDLFQTYIPDITYKLVRTREYSNEELLSKEDAISLLMLLNKIQLAEDFQEASRIPTDSLNEILQKASVDVADIILSTVRSLCRRLNLTSGETADFLEKVRGGNMGYLFENMEKMDIQLERRNTAEQRERAERAEQDAKEQRQRAEKVEQDKLALYRVIIAICRKQGMTQEETRQQLISEVDLKDDMADELIKKFWEK